MRLLFDQNLSHRLLEMLGDVFPGSLHVRFLDLAEADDLVIWNHARDHGLVIVTQDSDYADWIKFRGAPPCIVWLRCGNASVDKIHSKLRNAAERIRTLNPNTGVKVIEIW